MTVSAEQLWYTRTDRGIRGISGWDVRAASPGLTKVANGRITALGPFLSYPLPNGVNQAQVSERFAPVSLSLRVIDGVRTLIHIRAIDGEDWKGRPLVSFTHAVDQLPADMTARQAIATFGSPFWRTSDQGHDSGSQHLTSLTAADITPPGLVPDDLADPGLVDVLAFVINAYLALDPNQQLVIAAQPEMVAKLIYGIALSLPSTMTRDLTFNTFTPASHLHHERARIVGTCWILESNGYSPARFDDDLPQTVYRESGYAINTFLSDQRSSLPALPEATRWADFAAHSLTALKCCRLFELVDIAERVGLDRVDQLTMMLEFDPDHIDSGQIPALFEHQALASTLLRYKAVQHAFVDAIRYNAVWWESRGKRDATAAFGMFANTEVSSAIATNAVNAAVSELESGNVAVASRLFDELVPILLRESEFDRASALFNVWIRFGASRVRSYSREQRRWLLTQFAQIVPTRSSTDVGPLLDIPWEEMDDLLQPSTPKEWQDAAIAAAVMTREVPRVVSEALASCLEMTRRALELVMQRNHFDRAGWFLGSLHQLDCPVGLQLYIHFLQNDVTDGAFHTRFHDKARLKDDELAQLIEQEPHRVVELASDVPALKLLIESYVSQFSSSSIDTSHGLAAIHVIAQAASKQGSPRLLLTNDVQIRAIAWDDIADFVRPQSTRRGGREDLHLLNNALACVAQADRPVIVELLATSLVSMIESTDDLSTLLRLGAADDDTISWWLFVVLATAFAELHHRSMQLPGANPYLFFLKENTPPDWAETQLRRLHGAEQLFFPPPLRVHAHREAASESSIPSGETAPAADQSRVAVSTPTLDYESADDTLYHVLALYQALPALLHAEHVDGLVEAYLGTLTIDRWPDIAESGVLASLVDIRNLPVNDELLEYAEKWDRVVEFLKMPTLDDFNLIALADAIHWIDSSMYPALLCELVDVLAPIIATRSELENVLTTLAEPLDVTTWDLWGQFFTVVSTSSASERAQWFIWDRLVRLIKVVVRSFPIKRDERNDVNDEDFYDRIPAYVEYALKPVTPRQHLPRAAFLQLTDFFRTIDHDSQKQLDAAAELWDEDASRVYKAYKSGL